MIKEDQAMFTTIQIRKAYLLYESNLAAIPIRCAEIRAQKEQGIVTQGMVPDRLPALIAELDLQLKLLEFQEEIHNLIIQLIAYSLALGEDFNDINTALFRYKLALLYQQHLLRFQNYLQDRLAVMRIRRDLTGAEIATFESASAAEDPLLEIFSARLNTIKKSFFYYPEIISRHTDFIELAMINHEMISMKQIAYQELLTQKNRYSETLVSITPAAISRDLRHRYDIDLKDQVKAITASLHHYCEAKNYFGVVKVLENKSSTEKATLINENVDGYLPLHLACTQGDLKTVTYLLDLGANVSLVNGDGDLPIHIACKSGRIDLANALLDKGANLDILDNTGTTARQYAHFSQIHMALERHQMKDLETVPLDDYPLTTLGAVAASVSTTTVASSIPRRRTWTEALFGCFFTTRAGPEVRTAATRESFTSAAVRPKAATSTPRVTWAQWFCSFFTTSRPTDQATDVVAAKVYRGAAAPAGG